MAMAETTSSRPSALKPTALNTSIRFTNTIVGRSASVEQHGAVADAIAARDPIAARSAMRGLIGDVLDLIEDRGEG